jgi:hypothetical protein
MKLACIPDRVSEAGLTIRAFAADNGVVRISPRGFSW